MARVQHCSNIPSIQQVRRQKKAKAEKKRGMTGIKRGKKGYIN